MKCRTCPHLDIPEDQKSRSCCVDTMPGHRALEARMAAAKAAGSNNRQKREKPQCRASA